jgi:hypothetical protein
MARGKTYTPYAMHFQGFPINWSSYKYGALTGYPYAPQGPGIFQVRRTWHGLQNVYEKYYVPYNPKTPEQQAWRGVFALAIESWQALTNEEKSVYNKLKYPTKMSGYNRFIHYYMIGYTTQEAIMDNDARIIAYLGL